MIEKELVIISAIISLFFTVGVNYILPKQDNKKINTRKRFGLGLIFAGIWWTYLLWLLS